MIRGVVFDMYETLITHYHGKSPLYFSPQMAEEAGVLLEKFQAIWRGKEHERTIGKLSLEETIEYILRENDALDKGIISQIVKKRIATAEECFRNLHPDIIPMLSGLKEKGLRIGLISNCFSEEAEVIRRSVLAPYFDTICLSYELGVCKPERKIYQLCTDKLGVKAEECLYVGDGGSGELEAAKQYGMNAVQAVWYLTRREDWPAKQKSGFARAERPMDIVKIAEYETINGGK